MTHDTPTFWVRLGIPLVAVAMGVQGLWGLLVPSLYNDGGWIAVAWFGNDLITLLFVMPLLLAGFLRWQKTRSAKAAAFVLAALCFAFYNGLFYLLGAVLNAAFPLYAAIVLLAGSILCVALLGPIGDSLRHARLSPVAGRISGAGLALIGLCLGAVWLAFWFGDTFLGAELPTDEPVFRLVAALDLTIIAPLLTTGGLLALTTSSIGALIAPMAALFGVFYLCVLTLNSALLIRAGLAVSPGELPIWLPILAALSVIAALLWRAIIPLTESPS